MLRNYQREFLESTVEHYRQGVRKQLGVQATGCGKTVQAAWLPRAFAHEKKIGHQLLFLVHRKDLVNQTAKKFRQYNPDLKVDVERAEFKADPNADVVIASVQTIGKLDQFGAWGARISKFNPDHFWCVVVDECFPARTPVDGVPIHLRSIGDVVNCLDDRGQPTKKRVTHVFRNPAPSRMLRFHFSDGRDLTCTPNHPIHVAGLGYVPAMFVHGGCMVPAIMLPSRNAAYSDNMHGVRRRGHRREKGAHPRLEEHGAGVLQGLVPEGLAGEEIGREHGCYESQVCVCSHEDEQSDVHSGVSRKVGDQAARYGVEAHGQGRQWDGSHLPAVAACLSPWVGYGGGRAHAGPQGSEDRVSDLLQAGHRERRIEGWDRSGRQQSLLQEGAGPQEGGFLGLVRVDDIEVLEPGSDRTFGGVCPDGLVYNLEVEEFHNYFANGVSVHNCHHSIANQYVNVMRYFQVLKGERDLNQERLLVGLTATPNRTDGEGLEKLFDAITFDFGILKAIEGGWLARPVGHRVNTMTDISGVRTQGGDFAKGELDSAINTPERNDLILRKYRELGEGMPFIGFTESVQHAHDLAALFTEGGFMTMPVSGDTSDGERDKFYRLYAQGVIRGLFSCSTLQEGFDAPNATVALMARPTKSELWYQQAVGRVLRPYPAPEDAARHTGWRKPYSVVIDFVDNTGRHQLVTVPTLFGLRHDFNPSGEDVAKTAKCIGELSEQKGLDLSKHTTLKQALADVERIDLLAPPTVPEEVRKHSQMSWLSTGAGSYQIAMTDRTVFRIKKNMLGHCEVIRSVSGAATVLHVATGVEEAFRVADGLIPPDQKVLLSAKSGWRDKEPKEAQCYLLWKKDRTVKKSFPDSGAFFEFAARQFKSGNLNYSRGGISSMIDKATIARG